MIISDPDPLHFDVDPDPDLKSNKFQFVFLNFFSVKGIKLITIFFFVIYELIIHVYTVY